VLELSLENGGKGGSDFRGWEERTLDDGEDLVGGLGATAVAVIVEEINDTWLTELENVVRVGTEGDERLDHLPFERTGGQRLGSGQVGMSAGETPGIEKSARDELIESTHNAIGDALLLGLGGADGTDLLAHE